MFRAGEASPRRECSPSGSVSPRARSGSQTPVSPRGRAYTEGAESPRQPERIKPNRYGPERFFYDARTYTGVHKNGGPSIIDVHEDGKPVRTSLSARSSLLSTTRNRPKTEDLTQAIYGPLTGAGRDNSSTWLGSRSEEVDICDTFTQDNDELTDSVRSGPKTGASRTNVRYGPERFFYDRRSYTGVHRNGGPCTDDVRAMLIQH
eukprot:TRINITY_DN69930_c0_g1_i1.p1 TRINITY_DN69930_c0_g1~~TRINITY_DN69930_c0_g1_i1.p1  ORF type:complete len:213 (-),score=22.33 TRINITY_DN69930_c0_g1_i1:201-815(-)